MKCKQEWKEIKQIKGKRRTKLKVMSKKQWSTIKDQQELDEIENK